MFVSVTRDDLRDEFIMADEAFALSPISARAAQPREEDYEAISEAFMETSRGRWFLGEYARRNRNADTRMVLDAVARIEESLVAQKQSVSESGLGEALAAIRGAADEARALASAALDSLALDESLAPVRKGARVIREIAWRLREIGADGRICDLIDSQVSAIETGCGQISSSGPRAGLSAAFDLIAERIAAFDDSDGSKPPSAEDAFPSPSPAPLDEMSAAAVEASQPAIDTADAEPAPTPALPKQAVVAAVAVADVPAEAAADAQDEAVLDMVALEMAAADPSDTDDAFDADNPSSIDHDQIRAESTPVASEIIAQAPEPAATPTPAPIIQPSVRPSLVQSSFAPSSPVQSSPVQSSSVQSFAQTSPAPPPEPSLGATLIANGIVRGRHASVSDPLAPIRRMSQAEKIALFS
jgi:hypothetical protein